MKQTQGPGSAIFCFAGALFMVGLALFVIIADTNSIVVPVLCGGLGLLLGYIGYRFLQQDLANIEAANAFDRLDFTVRDDILSPGQTTAVDLRLTPTDRPSILWMTVRLISYEMVERQKRGKRIEERVEWHDEELDIRNLDSVRDAVEHGEAAETTANIEIPTDPDVHFGETGPLEWEVRLEINLQQAGDIRETRSLSVDHRELRSS